MAPTYNPDVFNVRDIPQAMRIILTPEDSTTEARWQIETPHVCDLIAQAVDIKPDSFVLDYGCGIGRIAKELIARHGCHVVGVDISPAMRVLSVVYVQSNLFASCTPMMLAAMSGITSTVAVASRAFRRRRRVTADMNRYARFLDWLRITFHRPEIEMLAVK